MVLPVSGADREGVLEVAERGVGVVLVDEPEDGISVPKDADALLSASQSILRE